MLYFCNNKLIIHYNTLYEFVTDIEGALVIADNEEMAGNNMTLDYLINENGTCTCKLCGEVTASRTHWYRHKYKVQNKKYSRI